MEPRIESIYRIILYWALMILLVALTVIININAHMMIVFLSLFFFTIIYSYDCVEHGGWREMIKLEDETGFVLFFFLTIFAVLSYAITFGLTTFVNAIIFGTQQQIVGGYIMTVLLATVILSASIYAINGVEKVLKIRNEVKSNKRFLDGK